MDDQKRKYLFIFLVFLFGLASAYIIVQIVELAGGKESNGGKDRETRTVKKEDREKKSRKEEDRSETGRGRVWEVPLEETLSVKSRVRKVVRAIEMSTEENWNKKHRVISKQQTALVRIGRDSFPHLKKAADHENPRVRRWVLGTIGEIIAFGNPTAAEQERLRFHEVRGLLVGMLKRDGSEIVREKAALVLAEIGDLSVAEPLAYVEQHDGSKRVKEAARFAIERLE